MEICTEYRGEDQHFLLLIQDSFLTQHVLEQNELVDNVKIHEPLGNSEYNQTHFDIKVKSESNSKKHTKI